MLFQCISGPCCMSNSLSLLVGNNKLMAPRPIPENSVRLTRSDSLFLFLSLHTHKHDLGRGEVGEQHTNLEKRRRRRRRCLFVSSARSTGGEIG